MKSEKLKVKNIKLKDKAVLIADVHYKKGDKDFLDLLQHWIDNPPSQVFLLGDIFHLLLPFEFLLTYNKEAIKLINKLSKKTEVFYTPGNHDFNIESIFPDVIFSDAFVDQNIKIILTHGDLTSIDFLYQIYVKIIRNITVNKILNVITLNYINNWLFKKILNKKIKCEIIENFEYYIKNKIKNYDYDLIIEGHYHQNVIFKEKKYYINIPAFVCSKSYCIIQLDKTPILKEIKDG